MSDMPLPKYTPAQLLERARFSPELALWLQRWRSGELSFEQCLIGMACEMCDKFGASKRSLVQELNRSDPVCGLCAKKVADFLTDRPRSADGKPEQPAPPGDADGGAAAPDVGAPVGGG